MHLVRLELKPGLGKHLRAGHPWVFRKALASIPRLPAGSVVDLAEDNRFMAHGYYDPFSAIAVRVLTRDPRENIDAAFFTNRIQRAFDLRRSLISLQDNGSYRLVHGEGDGLPGIVVDFYAAWCGPCKMIGPVYEGLAKTHEGKARFLKVNVDEVRSILEQYNVKAMPTFLFFDQNGNLNERLVGANAAKLQEIINKLAN